VLILDEATANLDYATELGIRHALLSRASHPTTLVITHRYSMAEICDKVIVLQAGRVAAQGTPGELRASCEWFAQFAASGAAQVESTDASSSSRDNASDAARNDDNTNAADADEELEDDT
jgi:ABC-type transport system involved in cytochrome bd biosynthesis fused ATPase/permease subunit